MADLQSAWDAAEKSQDSDLQSAWESAATAQPKPRFGAIQEPTFVDRAALAADKILTNLGDAVPIPEFMKPSRQQLVDVAAGASEMGGLLRNAPRLKNVATESGSRMLGRVLDPVANVVGAKAFQAATNAPRISAMAPWKQSVIGGAAAGGAVGTMQGEPLRGAAMGAAFGGGMSALGLLGRMAYDLAANLKSGAEGQVVNYLNKLFPDNKQLVIQTLDDLRALVPGEQPTAGMGAVSGQTLIPELKTLNEGASKRLGSLFSNREAQNEAARVAPLQEIAYKGQRFFDQDTGRVGMSEAEALRKQVTDPLYRMANPNQIAIDPKLQAILDAAQAAPLTARAERSIQQGQANAGIAAAAPEGVQPRFTGIRGEELGVVPNTPFMPQDPTRTIGELQRVKDELSKKITDLSRATDAPSKTLFNQLNDARRQLTEAMKTQSGSYAMANTIFKNYSAPQNQADVAEALLNALRSPSGAERQAAFLSAVKNAPTTLKRAGQKQFEDIREVMSPEQMRGAIRPITESVTREAAYQRLPVTEIPEMKGTLARLEEASPPLLNRVISIVRSFAKQAGADTDEAAQLILDKAVADPKALSALLKQTPPNQRNEVMNYVFEQLKNPQLKGAVAGSVVNQQ